MYTYNNGPEILRDTKKSTRLCPFTRHYCTSLCAMAVGHEDAPEGGWLCGLITKFEDGVVYTAVKYISEE